MKQLFKCKSCGFITEEGTFVDKCPACGVSEKMLEPFTDTISPQRRMILTQHIHPVIVHAPQAFAATFVVISILAFILNNPIKNHLFLTIQMLAIALPIVNIAAIASGIFDGITRFRRIQTPILRKKLIAGTIYFLISTGIIFSTQLSNFDSLLGLILTLILSIACFVCSFFLGKWGSSILNSYFPG